jgi:hypothetical protein
MRTIAPIAFVGLVLALPLAAQAKVSQAEADRLGKDLTPLGGEVAGNKDGSIPTYDGGLKAPPAGYKPGMSHINPFKDEGQVLHQPGEHGPVCRQAHRR